MTKFLLSDSLMCVDMLHIGRQLKALDTRMDWHHADVMDGHFCPNLTLSPDMVKAVCSVSKKPVEVHLMTTRPQDWIGRFAEAGASMIAMHAETINTAAFRLIGQVRQAGCQVGIVLNPATPFEMIRHYIDEVDRLTLMTVDVGYAGQPMVPQVVEKIREAAAFKRERGLSYEIQIDGCCNKSTYRTYAQAGAEILVMGSGLFGLSEDLGEALTLMERQQQEALADVERILEKKTTE